MSNLGKIDFSAFLTVDFIMKSGREGLHMSKSDSLNRGLL